MEQGEYPTNRQPSQHASLPAESIYYRHFDCRTCAASVDACSRCDRGGIYCLDCKPLQKRERIRRARNKYKKSMKGRIRRAASSLRRRAKIKAQKEQQIQVELPGLKKNEGDQGPPGPQVLDKAAEPVISAEQYTEGVTDNVQFPHPIFNSSADQRARSVSKSTQIICSFCGRNCGPFRRQKTGRLGTKEKKNFQRWCSRFRGKDP